MRRLILAGVALAALAPLAWAQTQAPVPAGVAPAIQMAQADDPPPPPPPPGGKHGRGPGGPGMMPPPPPPPRGPHIRLERGDTALDVACGEAETLKSCADTANQLIDKLGTIAVGVPPSPPLGAGSAMAPTMPPAHPPAPAN